MQMMPNMSWPQRVASDARGVATVPVAIAIESSLGLRQKTECPLFLFFSITSLGMMPQPWSEI
jgi:hypothetical protein